MKAYEGCVELLRIARSIAILAILLSFLTDIDTNMEYSVIHIICRLIFRYQSKINTAIPNFLGRALFQVLQVTAASCAASFASSSGVRVVNCSAWMPPSRDISSFKRAYTMR